jgi:predicted  nucleic acid-binding Zn-ribbon protein
MDSKRVEQLDIPSDLLTRQVEDARNRIEALAIALEAAVDAGGRRQSVIETSAKVIDELLIRLTNATRFSDIEHETTLLGAAISSTTVKIGAANDALETLKIKVTGIAEQVVRDGQAVSRARQSIDDDLLQSTRALHKLQGTLADVAEALVARIAPQPPTTGVAEQRAEV